MTANNNWNMSSSQAHNYMVDPLIAPDPSDETGLNSNHRPNFTPVSSSPNPIPEQQMNQPLGPSNPPLPNSPKSTANRPRGNSLSKRYPGDMSHRPLDMLKSDAKAAHRSGHLKKRSIPGVDTIDALDTVPGGEYHHEGPYDATLASRNLNSITSPVAAVAESNAQALKATPPEKIRDAIAGHRPLDGVADVPPGQRDRQGRQYDYKETNLMTDEGGDLGRLRGVEDRYDPNADRDITEENQMYEVQDGEATSHGSAAEIEMKDHPKSRKDIEIQEDEIDQSHQGSSKRHSLGEGLKKRLGSLRRKKD